MLSRLKSYRAPSFARLSSDVGDYVQVGHGGQLCILEYRDVARGRHFRAHLDEPHHAFPDGITISFAASTMSLAGDEIIGIEKVVTVFLEFLDTCSRPDSIGWRITDFSAT